MNKFIVDYDNRLLIPKESGPEDFTYTDLVSSIDVNEHENVFLLTVAYTTGDSFGRDPEMRYEYVDVFKTYEDALKTFKQIQEYHKAKKDTGKLTLGNGCDMQMYLPWEGYFEWLQFIDITEVSIKNVKATRWYPN